MSQKPAFLLRQGHVATTGTGLVDFQVKVLTEGALRVRAHPVVALE